MLSPRTLALFGATSLALLPTAALSLATAGGGPNCAAVRAEVAEVDFQSEIFFAVLEGLYRDGVTSEVAAAVIERDPQTGFPLSFVQACPICMPSLDAFRTYLERPPLSNKALTDTFGPGLDEAQRTRLTSPDGATRRAALQALVERWMQTHMARLRLTEAERAVWNQGLAERAKKGMSMLAEYKRDGVASYADFEDCPLCVGASDAARKP